MVLPSTLFCAFREAHPPPGVNPLLLFVSLATNFILERAFHKLRIDLNSRRARTDTISDPASIPKGIPSGLARDSSRGSHQTPTMN